MKLILTKLDSLLMLVFAVACGSPTPLPLKEHLQKTAPIETKGEGSQTQPTAANSASSLGGAAKSESATTDESQSLLLDKSLEEFLAREENLALNSPTFKVAGLRTGLEDRRGATIPFVSFLPVAEADYYQLARCDATALIAGPFDTLEEVELETVNLEDEIAKMIQNRFWNSVVSNPKCSVIEANLTSTFYTDLTFPNDAKKGKVKYVARACSSSGSAHQAGNRCSELVSLSPELPMFVNLKEEIEDFIKDTLREEENTIETASIDLAQNARTFAKALMKCEKENKSRSLSLERKKVLADIVSLGARIGSELILNDFSSPLAAAQSFWNKREVLKAESRPLSNVLREMFITEKHAQLSCYPAEKIAMESQDLLLKIEASKRKIASLKPSNTKPNAAFSAPSEAPLASTGGN